MAMFADGEHPNGAAVVDAADAQGSDMRTMLQTLLDDNEKQLSLASSLGQKFLAQRMELEERINQIIAHEDAHGDDDQHQDEAREKLQGLAEAVHGWQAENVQLLSGFSSSQPVVDPTGAPGDNDLDAAVKRESMSISSSGDLQATGTGSAGATTTRSAAQSSRRAKNAQHRANDVEFAFEIGSGLLTEVRRLQSLLGERDKAIQDLKEEKDDLDRTIDGLRAALRTQEGTADKYKEENWNLEVQLQELRVQFGETQATAQRLDGEHKRAVKQLAAARDTSEQHKSESERLAATLDEFKAKHETDVAQMRKTQASLQRDKSDLQSALDALKSDIVKKSRAIRRFGSPMTPGTDDRDPYTPQHLDDDEDPFGGAASTRRRIEGLTPADPHMDLLGGEPLSSPEPSPIRAPNHPANEIEALQQALAHAQRQIATLKGTVQREKQRRMEAVRQSRSFVEPTVGDDDDEEEDDDDVLEEGDSTTSGKAGLTPLRSAPRKTARGGKAVRKTNFQRKVAASDYPATAGDVEDEDEDMDPAFANVLQAPGVKGGFLHGASPLRKSSRAPDEDEEDEEEEDEEAEMERKMSRFRTARAPDSRPQSLVGAPGALAAELGLSSESRPQSLVASDALAAELGISTDSPNTTINGDSEERVRVVEKIVEVPVEKIVERIVEIPIEKIVEVEKRVEMPVEVEKIVERIVEVPVERIVEVPVDRIVEKRVEVPVEVERIVERIVEVPVDHIVEKIVEVEKRVEVPVEKLVTVEKIVYLPGPAPTDEESNKTDASIAFPGAYSRTPAAHRAPPQQPASAAHRSITSPIHPVVVVSDDEDTEVDRGTHTETEYEDARDTASLSVATRSREEFFSATDGDVQLERVSSDDEDPSDDESIKASRMPRRSIGGSTASPYRRTSSLRADVVQRTLVEDGIQAQVPKPEVKEMSMQTEEWTPPPVVPAGFQLVPVPPAAQPLPSPTSAQQFQYIPPASPSGRPQRDSGTRDPRPSIQSALLQAEEPRTRTSTGLTAGTTSSAPDRTRPPTMMLPPPPRMPPPPEKVAAAATTGSLRGVPKAASIRDAPPPRPTSPPPPQLIQRATTPTFGAMLQPPGSARKGTAPPSGMGPPQSVRGRPSDNSFRSGSTHLHAGHMQYASAPAGPGMGSAGPSASVYGSPRHGPRSTTSLVSSARSSMSRRSSVSSHHRPTQPTVPAADTSGAGPTTDPTIIHAITQTMIGEFLYKYTRPIVKRGGEKRHRRFFWVHPYTRTLYWSAADPGSANTAEASAKSAYIEGVRSVLDPNPSPPGLYPYSVVVSTPQREMKFTAPTKERHDIWFNALKYLLARPNPGALPGPGIGAPATHAPSSPSTPHHMRVMDANTFASPQSARSARSAHSGQSDGWNNITPKGFAQRSQTSVGKRTGTPALEYLRWAERATSPTPEPYEYIHGPGNGEDLDFEINDSGDMDDAYEGLDNVRACCDGMHDLGTLSKAGGKHHHHHHHHHHAQATSGGGQDLPPSTSRPVSPTAWSMRSRGSQHSQGEGSNLFPWGGRDQDGKRSWFGSKRSAKSSGVTS
ncbi:hypothetical protein EXIGLDRAFT_646596 [Exidia glandulosa HHB12029]|uniref:PH domain-containing protein n=1 Tax=Exidia glandulosa HHB12029 TaxID=1314781 RepID=A0A165I853_EXIGL|nr:hypothetical protein EXIGLDRAFT_646596 [Exidia glandulosa HHB12029]